MPLGRSDLLAFADTLAAEDLRIEYNSAFEEAEHFLLAGFVEGIVLARARQLQEMGAEWNLLGCRFIHDFLDDCFGPQGFLRCF